MQQTSNPSAACRAGAPVDKMAVSSYRHRSCAITVRHNKSWCRGACFFAAALSLLRAHAVPSDSIKALQVVCYLLLSTLQCSCIRERQKEVRCCRVLM
jgi:hypothetical protein